MSQCLRIICTSKNNIKKMYEFVKKEAEEHNLEGMVQSINTSSLRIVACGSHISVEKFLDSLHKSIAEEKIDGIEQVEPFLKDRDFRGVFRIIE